MVWRPLMSTRLTMETLERAHLYFQSVPGVTVRTEWPLPSRKYVGHWTACILVGDQRSRLMTEAFENRRH
jgi:hypothetical protein